MKKIGAIYNNGSCHFTVWAPEKDGVDLHIVQPQHKKVAMSKYNDGYFSVVVNDILPGTRYFYNIDGKDIPDPASHFQPEGVHGPSEVINHDFPWTDKRWKGILLKDCILYELHVGAFTPEGTFEAIIPRLKELVDIGINAIEIMPVSQFPGERNWGYDGVFPYAVQNSYGGPDGLKKLVDACHRNGIAVFLDVVYNHLGPEGNYLNEYAPYFTDKYKTPWGNAINFDGAYCDGVREYFCGNALYWFENFHIDGLRLDAIHAIYDSGAINIWEFFYEKVRALEQKLGRQLYLIAECDDNNPKVIQSPAVGGYGLDGHWLDDFHHALFVILHKPAKKLYEDFGTIEQLAKCYTDGFVHSGEYVRFRKRKHGASSIGIPGDKFVVFNQNHDQVGNRVHGERLSAYVDFEKLKLAAVALLLSPYIPLLFMGEEYAEDNPFLYFINHSDEELIKAVQEGRKREFSHYYSGEQPADPNDVNTYLNSKLSREKRNEGHHAVMLQWYKELIAIRHTHPAMQNFQKKDIRVNIIDEGLILYRQDEDQQHELIALFNFSPRETICTIPYDIQPMKKILNSKDAQWLTKEKTASSLPGEIHAQQVLTISPFSVAVFTN